MSLTDIFAAPDNSTAPAPWKKQIFVCGAGHSGTTLLLAVLDSHHQVSAVPRETGVFLRVDDDEEVKAIVAHWPWKFHLREALYIAEKTPRHALKVDRILGLLPDARVIGIIRDGRDMSISAANRVKGDFTAAVRNWTKSNNFLLKHKADPRVHLMKYEDLIANFDETVAKMCAFLELEFDPAMRDYHKVDRRWYAKKVEQPAADQPLTGENHMIHRNWQINQPLFDARGRWKEAMTQEQKGIFKSIGGPTLISLGYAQDLDW